MATFVRTRPAVAVEVTDHARERARERHPGFKAARIVDEVRAALCAGRYGAQPPGRSGQSGSGILYAWTEDGGRCYAIRARAHAMVVVTTLPPVEAAAA